MNAQGIVQAPLLTKLPVNIIGLCPVLASPAEDLRMRVLKTAELLFVRPFGREGRPGGLVRPDGRLLPARRKITYIEVPGMIEIACCRVVFGIFSPVLCFVDLQQQVGFVDASLFGVCSLVLLVLTCTAVLETLSLLHL